MLTDEVNKFIANLNSNKAQIKNGTKKQFTMKYKDTTKIQSVNIPKTSISTTSIFSQKLKLMNGLQLTERPVHDCRLLYTPKNKKYIICIPVDIPIR